MNRILTILLIALMISSCDSKNEIQGYWRLDFDEQPENPFFPFELRFRHDTLELIDGNTFKQVSQFKMINDRISLVFENGSNSIYPISIQSDSVIYFASRKFFRTSKDYYSTTQSYELLGYQSENKFKPENYSDVIHLIKDSTTTKVILNDLTCELTEIPEFLTCYDCEKPFKLNLYLGKGIEFKDLIEAYCWIKIGGLKKVELITSNESFEVFYSIKDYINIGDSLFLDFTKNQHILPPPPKPKDKFIYNKEIQINDINELNQIESLVDSTSYLISVSEQLGIIEYLKLTEKINALGKKDIKKKIKRLTTAPNSTWPHLGH